MTLLLLVAAGQWLDGLTYLLAHGHGTELNPAMAAAIEAYGPEAVALGKVAAGAGLVALAAPVRHRRRLLAAMALVGCVGAITNLLGALP